MAREQRPRIQYRERDPRSIEDAAKQQGGAYDSPFDNVYPRFSPKKGEHRIRILPPTWNVDQKGRPLADHYAIEIWVHRNVGPEKGYYVCGPKTIEAQKEPFLADLFAKHSKGEACAVCEEAARAQREGEDDKYLASLRPKQRRVFLMIDRNHENDGPMLWDAGWTTERDIANACISEDKETLWPDHPDNGYDVLFLAVQDGDYTKYTAVKAARRSSPLSDDQRQYDEWFDFIASNPLCDRIVFHDQDKVRRALSGGSGGRDDSERDAPPRSRSERNTRDEESTSRSSRYDDDEPAPRAREDDSRRSSRYDDDEAPRARDDEPAPSRSRAREDEPAPRSSRYDDDEPAPRSRPRPREDAPSPRRTSRYDDDGGDSPRGDDLDEPQERPSRPRPRRD